MRTLLRQYVATRLAFSRDVSDAADSRRDEARTNESLDAMWTLAVRVANRDPRSTMTPLFVQALSDTIDESADQAAALSATIPESVIGVLVALVLIAVGMMGYGFGRTGIRRPAMSLMLAVMFALVIETILDLDRPQQGLIRVSLQPLVDVQTYLESRR